MVIVAVIVLSSATAAYIAVQRLLHPHPVTHLAAVAAAAAAGFAGNELVARYRITTGRRIGSAALVADGLHARTDGFTSLAVLAGGAGGDRLAVGRPGAWPAHHGGHRRGGLAGGPRGRRAADGQRGPGPDRYGRGHPAGHAGRA